MRTRITILLLLVSLTGMAQADSISLKKAVAQLDKALLSKDKVALEKLLNKEVSYGHSSGWIETKNDVVKDLVTGFLVYNKLDNSNTSIKLGNNWASVRTNTMAEGVRDGKPFQLTLHVLQVWIKTSGGWQLIARQSTKLN